MIEKIEEICVCDTPVPFECETNIEVTKDGRVFGDVETICQVCHKKMLIM